LEALETDAVHRRRVTIVDRFREFACGRGGGGVLFVVAAVPVTVLEVDPHVFDRLGVEFVPHPKMHLFGKLGRDVECLGKQARGTRFRLECRRGPLTPLGVDVSPVRVRGDVHSVYRLTYSTVAGIQAVEVRVRVREPVVQLAGQILETIHHCCPSVVPVAASRTRDATSGATCGSNTDGTMYLEFSSDFATVSAIASAAASMTASVISCA